AIASWLRAQICRSSGHSARIASDDELHVTFETLEARGWEPDSSFVAKLCAAAGSGANWTRRPLAMDLVMGLGDRVDASTLVALSADGNLPNSAIGYVIRRAGTEEALLQQLALQVEDGPCFRDLLKQGLWRHPPV